MRLKIAVSGLLVALLLVSGCAIPGYLPISETTPYIISPAPESLNVSRVATLNWNVRTETPAVYTLYLGEGGSHEMLPVAVDLQESFFLPDTPLKANTLYYWRIIASYQSEGGKQSQAQSPLAQFTTGAHQTPERKYFLLTLGLTDYESHLSQTRGKPFVNLSLTDEDSVDFVRVFRRLNEPYRIRSLTGRVIESQISEAINQIALEASPEDFLVFHFSGHGFESGGTSMLVLSDTPQPATIDEEAKQQLLAHNISTGKLKAMLSAFLGEKMIVVDACNAGQFAEISLLTNDRELQSRLMSESSNRFAHDWVEAFKPDSSATLLNDRLAASGIYHVMTGSTVDLPSFEHRALQNGFFTYSFLNGLGDAEESTLPYDYSFDANPPVGNYEITFQELFNHSYFEVRRLFYDYAKDDLFLQSQPQPQTIHSYSPNEDFVLTRYFRKIN